MPNTTGALLHKPAAWLPIVLSVAALALIGAVVAAQGAGSFAAAHDEGTPARIFQLVMLVDVAAIALFGLRWLPTARGPALAVLTIQVLFALLPVLIIILLEG